jgi:hypothetical protein
MFQRDLRVIPTKFANRFGQLEERQRRAIVQWLNQELHDALTKYSGAAKALATKRTAVDDEIDEE